MLKFLVFEDGKPAQSWPLRNAYLIGSDSSAMRAQISFEPGVIICEKRETGAAALALQHRVGDLGELTIQTCLLPEREAPYLLTLELARHRLMLVYAKLEEWGMIDLEPDHAVTRRTALAHKLFIEALCAMPDDLPKANKLAHDCLIAALDASEELALAHSELLLNKRKSSGSLPRFPIGCGISLDQGHDRLRLGLQSNFDFVQLPTPWKTLAPEEGEYHWQMMDSWAEWAARTHLPVVAGPLVSFDTMNVPDWLYIWEHDYETVRDLMYEHVERVVSRYKNLIGVWKVVSGLHVNNHFSFNFEQLMDLTRMATMQVKKISPNARVLIELRQPFGEYYATNPRSIPPRMYVDLIVQSGIHFDGFALKLLMGQAMPGEYTRDLMQISNLIDQFSGLGKPLYITTAAPSETVTQMMLPASESGEPVDPNSGFWRRPWSMQVQGHWLEAVLQIAISKPFVEAVSWQELADHPQIELPLAGLIREDFQPKSAFRRLISFRSGLLSEQSTDSSASIAATVPVAEEDEADDSSDTLPLDGDETPVIREEKD